MAGDAVAPDEDALPLSEDELQAMALRATLALAKPPGRVAPEPRPRRDDVAALTRLRRHAARRSGESDRRAQHHRLELVLAER
jgi:hypothetical protein